MKTESKELHNELYKESPCTVRCARFPGRGLFFFLPHSRPSVASSPQQPTGRALIARGEYLTIAADCAACHTSRGGKPFAGGLPFKLPFGTIYSSNITTDNDHGIGSWTDAEFVRQ